MRKKLYARGCIWGKIVLLRFARPAARYPTGRRCRPLSTEKELFARTPVLKAIAALALPTVLSQLITVVYNMADTFFIGQMGDPAQVAAAAVALPFFIFMTGVSNLFGIGGSSFISRALGAGDGERASRGAAFCIYGAAATALAYGLAVLLLRPLLLPLLGATSATYAPCARYVFWTVGFGAVPTVMNAAFAHLVRAEGHFRQASFGMAFGGLLNIALDPLFIFTLGLRIEGAAIATMLSNAAAAAYYVVFIYGMRGHSAITLSPKKFALRGVAGEVLSVGAPSFVTNMMSTFSNGALTKIISSYSSEAVAGMGIAKKVHLIAVAVARGMTQGPLPLIGYNYASGDRKRMMRAIKTLCACCLCIGVAEIFLLHATAGGIMRFFIDDAETVGRGAAFMRVICLDCPTTMLCFLIITLFQATGEKLRPLFLSFLRKGSIDVPFMFLFNSLFGISGIAWATPCADSAALAVSLALFLPHVKKLVRADGDAAKRRRMP